MIKRHVYFIITLTSSYSFRGPAKDPPAPIGGPLTGVPALGDDPSCLNKLLSL